MLTGLDKLATASVKPIEPKSKPCPNGGEDSRRARMPFEDGGVCGNQEGRRDNKEIEGLHSLGCVKGKPIPGMFAGLLGYVIGIRGCHWPCRPDASKSRLWPPPTCESWSGDVMSAKTRSPVSVVRLLYHVPSE